MNPSRQIFDDTQCEIPIFKIKIMEYLHLRQFDWGDGLLKSNEGIQ